MQVVELHLVDGVIWQLVLYPGACDRAGRWESAVRLFEELQEPTLPDAANFA